MKTIVSFTDPHAVRTELAGGKGANLARLTQGGFNVPPGFVIVAEGYREFARRSGELPASVESLPFSDPSALRAASAALRARLAQVPLPAEVEAELRSALSNFPPDTAFSVRSSSTFEDLAGAAFAGQHETFLNVSGADRVVERVRECYLSLWGDRAVAYRHQQQFDQSLAAMAVVVQQMVPAEVAGVGFSMDPVGGRLDRMLINANFGLGESVVSGEADVDQWVLDKASRSVVSAQIARKTRQVVGTARGTGTTEIEVTEAEATRACLSPAQLAELADLLVRVEQSYGFPQDIEWAFAAGHLHLLQSRPITTIPPRWTRDESAERFPTALTPLTWDLVEGGFHRSLNHSFRLLGFPPFSGKWFAQFGHYIYGNQNAVELYARRAPFRVRSVDELRTALPRLRTEYQWVQELPVQWMRDLDHYLITLGRFLAEPLEGRPLREVWAYVLAVHEHGARYFLPNIAISIAHGTLYRLLHGLLQLVVGPDGSRLFDQLLAYCETKTGQINKELFELAQMIRRHPQLTALFERQSSRDLAAGWTTQANSRNAADDPLAAFPEFRERFGLFLRDHGHREVEFDAYVPTWLEQPWVVFDNLRLILQTPTERRPTDQERELKIRAQEAELELYSRLPSDLHFLFHELIRLARTYTSLDDLEHYQTTRLTLPLRRGLRELGRRLVNRGVLSDPMDVFFAHVNQLQQAVDRDNATDWNQLATAIVRQKAEFHADQARLPAWTLEPEVNAPQATAALAHEGDCLKGLAGSPGIVEGVVFRVQSSDDFGRFPKGAVLVARTTNPTWTPLFYSASAVVTESGGPLSHGAVTAREMRIPAVMSVRGCLAWLQNGQRVRVDGAAGQVWLLPS